ncbi:MAG: hypothetical protein ABEJ02_03980 [Candidatus Paceibacteria bacterium]
MRSKNPDREKAKSLLNASSRDMEFTLNLDLSESSASTIVRNVYECFRKVGDSLLILEGFESKDHLEPINALMELNVETERPLGVIDNLRKIRHSINYRGYVPSVFEAREAIDIARKVYFPLVENIKKRLESNKP